MDEGLHIGRAAAPGDHLRMQAVGERQDGLPLVDQALPRRLRVRCADHLHLADQHRIGALSGKPAAEPGDPGGARQTGDDGGLLHH